jgi:hypothetical protein
VEVAVAGRWVVHSWAQGWRDDPMSSPWSQFQGFNHQDDNQPAGQDMVKCTVCRLGQGALRQ